MLFGKLNMAASPIVKIKLMWYIDIELIEITLVQKMFINKAYHVYSRFEKDCLCF